MAPLSWMNLMSMFIATFMILNSIKLFFIPMQK